MLINTLTLGLLIGLIHFMVVGILYGNPFIDRIYQSAQSTDPGVRKWTSKGKYLLFQFLGTQIEVFILALGFFWLRPVIPGSGVSGALPLAFLFAAIRVYPRFWNMWIQSTYPNRLLMIEFINGTISTFTIVCGLQLLSGGVIQ